LHKCKTCVILEYQLKQKAMTHTIKNNYWNQEYKHNMRGLKPSKKIEVYNLFLEFGLCVNGTSDLHYELILEATGEYLIKGETIKNMLDRLDKSYVSR